MADVELKTSGVATIRFKLCSKQAPITCEAFKSKLPLTAEAVHAKSDGEEIWIKNGPLLDIIDENSTFNPKIGEIGCAPNNPNLAIVYGNVKFSERVNMFARVYDDDLEKLKNLGKKILIEGTKILQLELNNN